MTWTTTAAVYAAWMDLGQACEMGETTVPGPRASAADAVAAATGGLQPTLLPLRRLPVTPKVAAGHGLVFRCRADLGGLADGPSPSLGLGRIFGRSQIWLNGRLRAAQRDDGPVELPLVPEDLRRDAELVIASDAGPEGFAGPVTLVPLSAAPSRAVLTEPRRLVTYPVVELPLAIGSLSLAAGGLFALIWLFGIRRADVSWITIGAAAVAAHQWHTFAPAWGSSSWSGKGAQVSYMAMLAALNAFQWSFAAPSRRRLSLPFLLAVAVAAALYAADVVYYAVIVALPNLLSAGVALAAVVRLRRAREPRGSGRRGDVLVFGLTTSLYAAALVVDTMLMRSAAVSVHLYAIGATLAAYAGLLAFDLVVVYRRVAEERARREKAEQANVALAAVARAAQTIAHDVRRPLTLAGSLIEILQQPMPEADLRASAASLLPELTRARAAVEAILEDVLAVGLQQAAALRDGELASLLAEALAWTARSFPTARVTVTTDLAHTHLVRCDAPRMARVFGNVLANAVEACGGSGTLRVRACDLPATEDSPARVRITIANDGPRLDAATRARLFEPFFTQGKAGGTGLGLAVVKRLVELQGGEVTVGESAEGWVEFAVSLTAGAAAAHGTSPAQAALASFAPLLQQPLALPPEAGPAPRAAVTVAIVDDSAILRGAWAAKLRDVAALTFASPEAFQRHCDAEPQTLAQLACVVTDLHFGSISATSGRELAVWIKARGPTPVLLCTEAALGAGPAPDGIDAVIPKTPLPWPALAALAGLVAGIPTGPVTRSAS